MNRSSQKKYKVSEAVFLGVSEPSGPFYFWRMQEMPYEEFSFWDRYEYDQNYSPPERNMQSCACFWNMQGEQDCWDKDTVSFILERERERES